MNPENADLLTNAAAALERYRLEEQQLESEISVQQARLELVREFVAALAGKPRARRSRPPGPKLVDPLGVLTASPSGIEMPLRVAEPDSAA
jgi:hypothetical protein